MLQTHDYAALRGFTLGCARGNNKILWHGAVYNRKRVVSGGIEVLLDVFENQGIVVAHN